MPTQLKPELDQSISRRFGTMADELDLDLERFEADISDHAIKARVERDVESCEQSGVDGTPSLFIDGLRYRGPRDTNNLGNAPGDG